MRCTLLQKVIISTGDLKKEKKTEINQKQATQPRMLPRLNKANQQNNA
jgi:hypothetical protein